MPLPPLPAPAPPHLALVTGHESGVQIRTVARLTGLSEQVLRVWERRYGVPAPSRARGGYRLFGTRELEEVRAMMRLCERGLGAGEAARVVLAARESARSATGSDIAELSHDAHRLAVWAVVDAVSRFDDDDLERALDGAMELGSAAVVMDRVLLPAIQGVARHFSEGRITDAQERLASHAIRVRMSEALSESPGSAAPERALLACFAEESRELELLAMALCLSDLGLRPVILGPRTPPRAVAEAVRGMSPRFVCLSTTSPLQGDGARVACEAYAAACEGVPWVVGGSGAKAIAAEVEAVGGHVIAASRPLRGALGEVIFQARGSLPALEGT